MSSRLEFPLRRPGFNLPLNHTPWEGRPEEPETWLRDLLFPNALIGRDLEDGPAGRVNTFREILMMRVINTITEKPEWDRKVFDKDIVSKWRDEIAASGEDITPKMMDWIFHELQLKAETLQEKNYIRVFDAGVFKADSAVTEEERGALQDAVAPLEQIPEDEKDYHPRSDGKVVDLVHPSLFPLIYGRTRILPDRLIGLDDCTSYIEKGEVLKVPSEEESFYSRTFQWLPCDVEFQDDNGCRIVSYINNLNPSEHRPLYTAIENVLNRAIPLWNETLTLTQNPCPQRMSFNEVEYLPHSEPEPEPGSDQESDSDSFVDVQAAWERRRPIRLPEPVGSFDSGKISPDAESCVNLRKDFREGIQVIVKLATIELTPEKPEYEGGSWHVEGQQNEHICATALYYYDSQNITESTLAFRQSTDTQEISSVSYEQDQHAFLQLVYGFAPEVDSRNETNITQHLGSVVSKEGRLLTFPNILQHRVSPFGLADRTKPGHRKILALFLVDPHLRIISTANVPPQQEAWAEEKSELVQNLLTAQRSAELQDIVKKDVAGHSISLDEAKQYRLELMDERSLTTDEHNEMFSMGEFNLCEH
ncbi:hypothetical protein FE257_010779 [Aspergillus nanangensis]|uniref:Uncharacterized protein n=1 Tax=Aspergillus nanangensis TaxID=2582783 RepID=A0AAD4CVZ4_ASPNN|nr:hypothetical protein FE257_010779 [Aspergillus nanangensis]